MRCVTKQMPSGLKIVQHVLGHRPGRTPASSPSRGGPHRSSMLRQPVGDGLTGIRCVMHGEPGTMLRDLRANSRSARNSWKRCYMTCAPDLLRGGFHQLDRRADRIRHVHHRKIRYPPSGTTCMNSLQAHHGRSPRHSRSCRHRVRTCS